MATSQNGWPASSDKNAIGITSPKVPGTNVDFPQGVKGGDVETVLMYVAEQFHKTVEPLKDGWCWGYFYRAVTGGSDLSNHASGTAIDLNAPNHPIGSSGTFNGAKREAINRILVFLEGVVRWGGNYSGRKDEMHFEIVGSASAVARVANKIKVGATPTPRPPVPGPVPATLQKGSKGESVRVLQRFFLAVFPVYRNYVKVRPGVPMVVDGDFGAQTEAWVKEFQSRTGLTADGIVGPATVAKLRQYGYSG